MSAQSAFLPSHLCVYTNPAKPTGGAAQRV
jgi:hypothetical protein